VHDVNRYRHLTAFANEVIGHLNRFAFFEKISCISLSLNWAGPSL